MTAIDHYEGGLLLQCDISHRVLRTETVRDALTTLKKRGGDLKTEAEKALLGVSILTRSVHTVLFRQKKIRKFLTSLFWNSHKM